MNSVVQSSLRWFIPKHPHTGKLAFTLSAKAKETLGDILQEHINRVVLRAALPPKDSERSGRLMLQAVDHMYGEDFGSEVIREAKVLVDACCHKVEVVPSVNVARATKVFGSRFVGIATAGFCNAALKAILDDVRLTIETAPKSPRRATDAMIFSAAAKILRDITLSDGGHSEPPGSALETDA